MYSLRSFRFVTELFSSLKSIRQITLLKQSEKCFSSQARYMYFTGSYLPWYKTAQLKGVTSENARLSLPIIVPCAFNSVTVKALAKNITAVRTADEYLYLYDNFKDSAGMTQVNRITILHHLARFAVSPPKKNFVSTKKALKKQKHVFIVLLNSIAAELDRCKARDLASIIWSLGKLREHVAWFVSECEKEILRRDASSFRAPSICQLLNGFASLDLKRSQFFTLVEQRILEGQLKMSDFENRGLAGALWSFSKTGNGSRELYGKFQEEILLRDVKKFSSAQLAQFLWSFTQKDVQCDRLFQITAQEILKRPMVDLSDYSIKTLLQSFAKAGADIEGSTEFFDSLGAQVIQQGVQGYDTEELSMLVWSFAKMCSKVDAIFDIVEEELHLRGISHLRNQELALILWSFAESGHFSANLFNACQEEILSRDLRFFKVEQLSQLVWALGKSTVSNSGFFSRVEKEVLCNVSIFSDKELCMVLHGFSCASAGSYKLFKKMEREVLDRNLLEHKPELIPELASVFSKCSFETTLIFDAMEKALKNKDLSVFRDHELQCMKMAFSKVRREVTF
ncbi:hypothetical protein ACROYT_G040029, partial [Oculina patagonica]